MDTNNPYVVPEQSAVRTAAKMAAQYRAQLDQESLRRREGTVIDVTARRVSIETDASPTRGARQSDDAPENQTPASRETDPNRSSTQARRAQRLDEEIGAPADEGFIYEPNADEIDMRPSPKERGLFIDYMA